jgi:hypothetical protein
VSGRVEPDPQSVALAATLAQTQALLAEPIAPLDPDEGWRGGSSLPNDHPAWMRDTVSVSQRARALLARIAPVAVRVIAFWEHRVKSIAIGNRTLSVDASGSYRCS